MVMRLALSVIGSSCSERMGTGRTGLNRMHVPTM